MLPLRLTVSLGLLLALSGNVAQAKKKKAPRPGLELTGTKILSEKIAIQAMGKVPAKVDQREAWAQKAVKSIIKSYRSRGYTYVRAWHRVEEDGSVRINVDEGRIHRVAFVGADAYKSLLLRVDLYLPKSIFHEKTIARSLRELKDKHGFRNIYYRVVETRQNVRTPLGDLAPQRVMRIFVVSNESFGWGLGLELSSTWGLVPEVSFHHRGLLLDNDRFSADAGISIPYRRFFFEEEPVVDWVHGQLRFFYRLPTFSRGFLAPQLDSSTAVSRYGRSDLNLARAYVLRSRWNAQLALLFPNLFTTTVGGGVDYINVFSVESLPDTTSEVQDRQLVRFSALLSLEYEINTNVLRADQRDVLMVDFTNLFTTDGTWLLDTELVGQGVINFGFHDLILRGRALYLYGDILFFDEAALAGSYQRVFFGNRFWVREAIQLETAFRLAVWKDIMKIGIFHDISLFGDRTTAEVKPALANAFGPSAHFLLFDLFALDIYYGFGFTADDFSHNLSLSAVTVF